MNLSPKERNVLQMLRRHRVATAQQLQERIGVARSTITRALRKHGYYSSCNYNGAYLTLRETPHFDDDGLWRWNGACFSKHPNLRETILQLVHRSDGGCTAEELQRRLNTRVHNQLNRLLGEQQLKRCTWGRRVVYLCRDPQRAAWQQKQRQPWVRSKTDAADFVNGRRLLLPSHCSLMNVLHTLKQWIQTPQASDASLSKQLQAQGVPVEASQVRQVVQFFDLEEKKGPWRSRR